MAQTDPPREPPGSFGIEGAVRGLRLHIDQALGNPSQIVQTGFRRQERKLDKTMADLQTLADLVTQARGDAAAEATEVKAKLDEMNAKIAELSANANDPVKVQAIADDLGALRTDIQAVFTGETPPGARRK